MRRRGRLTIWLARGTLAILAVAILAALALSRRDVVPASRQIAVGTAWIAVPLAEYRSVPLMRLTADAPFSLRLDGDRVTRAVPGSGAVIRPGALRSLELRAGRGPTTVTLTPRRD